MLKLQIMQSLTHSVVIVLNVYHSPCKILQCIIYWKWKLTVGITTVRARFSA